MNELTSNELQDVVGGAGPYDKDYTAHTRCHHIDGGYSGGVIGSYATLIEAEQAAKASCLWNYDHGCDDCSYFIRFHDRATGQWTTVRDRRVLKPR